MLILLILSILAACGVLSILWVFLGWLLPGQRRLFAVYVCRGEEIDALLRRYRWLRDMGVIRGRLLIVDEGMTEQQKQWTEKHMVEICTREELADRVREERGS